MFQMADAQAGFLFEFAVRGHSGVLAPIDVPRRKLPHHAAQRVAVLADANGPVGVVQGQDDDRARAYAQVGIGHLARIVSGANLVLQDRKAPPPHHPRLDRVPLEIHGASFLRAAAITASAAAAMVSTEGQPCGGRPFQLIQMASRPAPHAPCTSA